MQVKLPPTSDVPVGTLYYFYGDTYENMEISGWKKTTAPNNPILNPKPVTIEFYREKTIIVDISPPKQRARGRPKKETPAKPHKREMTEYNLYVKEHMLSGIYSHQKGSERLKSIALMYTKSNLTVPPTKH